MALEELIQSTEIIKFQMMELILTRDLRKDGEAQRIFVMLGDALDRLGLEAEEVLPEEFFKSYMEGFDAAADDVSYRDVAKAINPDGTFNSALGGQINMQALESSLEDTMIDLRAAYRTFELNAITSIDETLNVIKSGVSGSIMMGVSKDQVAKRVAQEFNRKGTTAFITKDGKALPLDFYSRTVVFTKLSQARNRGAINRYENEDMDTVRVVSNDPTCEECAKHSGMVYSISGESDKYPKLPEDLLPIHPHCQCGYEGIAEEYLDEDELAEIEERVKQGTGEDPRTEEEKAEYNDIQEARRKANEEKKLYARMVAELGDEAPKSIGAFRRMKRQGTDNYKELYSKYLSSRQKGSVKKSASQIFKEPDINILEKKTEDWWLDMSDIEKDAIVQFTRTSPQVVNDLPNFNYHTINSTLYRNKKLTFGKERVVSVLDEALDKYELEEGAKFIRGMSDEEFKTLSQLSKTGEPFKEYKSTSASKTTAEYFSKDENINGWVVEFEVPPGRRGAYIGSYSAMESEKEFLLKRNQKVYIREVDEENRSAIVRIIPNDEE